MEFSMQSNHDEDGNVLPAQFTIKEEGMFVSAQAAVGTPESTYPGSVNLLLTQAQELGVVPKYNYPDDMPMVYAMIAPPGNLGETAMLYSVMPVVHPPEAGNVHGMPDPSLNPGKQLLIPGAAEIAPLEVPNGPGGHALQVMPGGRGFVNTWRPDWGE